MMAETFRNVRTNVQYMLGSNQKVVLITSTTSGEGKSFVAANLAISFALLGKKVVIVGLDIRKPGLNKAFQMSHKEDGIARWCHPSQPDRTGGTRLAGTGCRPVEKGIRLCDTRYRSHRYGDRHPTDFARGRHEYLRMPCRLYTQSRLSVHQRTERP